MKWCRGMEALSTSLRAICPVLFLLFLIGCGGDDDVRTQQTPISTARATSTPLPALEATPTSNLTAGVTPNPTQVVPSPTSVPSPEPTPTPAPLRLELFSPQDGVGVEIGTVAILGKTRPDAVVAVNGVAVDVESNGTFRQDVILEEGANLIEVVSTDLRGEVESEQVAAFFVSATAGLPFTLLYPPDGLDATESSVPVLGATRPDAVVGVNGIPVDVNALGIFSTTVPLEEGANLIEVVATDLLGNVRFQTVAVFYLP